MPPVIAAVVAVAAWTVTVAGTSIAIGSIIVGTVLSVGLSLAARAIMGKPKSLEGGQTLSFRASAPAAPIIYGETRVGGPIIFMATTGSGDPANNKYLWLSVALAGHEVDNIGDIYFNDEVVEFDTEESGTLTRGSGQGYFYGAAHGTAATAPAGGLRNVAWLLKRHGRYDQPVQANVLQYWLTDQALTSADTFKGVAYLAGTFLHLPDKYPSGPPNLSAIVRGRKVYDPRIVAHDIDDPETWEWTDNPALCIADFLRGCPMLVAAGVIVRPYGLGVADADIDWDGVTTAANICDESVAYSGGTQKRFTCNGTIDSDVSPKDALRALTSSMAGSVAWSGGQWKIFAGAYRTPTVTLGDDDQCSGSRTQARRARRDLFNGVKGKFRGAATFYQTTDFPRVSSSVFIAQDNGEEIYQDVELPFTDTASMCQRIAKIDLWRNRSQIVTERTFKLSALGTQVGDVILLNDSRKGWTSKPFEISRWVLRTEQDENGIPALVIDMTLVETSSAVYDWEATEEQLFTAQPTTSLPRPWEVALPGAPAIVEELYSTRDGSGVKTRVTVSWSDATEGYFLDYIPEFKLSSASAWLPLPAVTGPSIIISDIAAGNYDFRVKTRNTLGVSSEYSTTEGLTVYGLGATPSALTNLGIQPLGNQAVLAWDQSLDLDVREGGFIEFRHSPALTGVTWENSMSIREAVSGQQSYANVPLKAGTYVIRPVDSSGIAGPETSVPSKQASINGFTSLGGSPIAEQTSFAGTHSNTVGGGSVLKLANTLLWDDITDLDALATNIDETGGISASGTYTFTNAFDFGSVTRVRLTSNIAAVVTNILSNIDDIAANIDDWESFDANLTGGQSDAWVEYRQTDDNPAGSPTWTSWQRLDAVEAECRAAQFRAQLRSYDTAYNVEISTLQIAAEQRT